MHTSNNNMTPAQRESLIKAIASGDFATVQSIQSQIELKKDNRDVIHLNTFIDFMKMASVVRNQRIPNSLIGSNAINSSTRSSTSANEEVTKAYNIFEDPNIKIEVSPYLQSILDQMMDPDSRKLNDLDKEAIRKYEAKFDY